jgi:hypothetical protein
MAREILSKRNFLDFESPDSAISRSPMTLMKSIVSLHQGPKVSKAKPMRNLWCLEKNSILPFIISATGTVTQSLFKNLKILDFENTLVVEIQKGILLYSCHIVRKFLNIDTEHKTQKSQNLEAKRR